MVRISLESDHASPWFMYAVRGTNETGESADLRQARLAGRLPWPKSDHNLVVGRRSNTWYMNLQYKHGPNDFDRFQGYRVWVLDLDDACLILASIYHAKMCKDHTKLMDGPIMYNISKSHPNVNFLYRKGFKF
jgi:hypothetical protein